MNTKNKLLIENIKMGLIGGNIGIFSKIANGEKVKNILTEEQVHALNLINAYETNFIKLRKADDWHLYHDDGISEAQYAAIDKFEKIVTDIIDELEALGYYNIGYLVETKHKLFGNTKALEKWKNI